MIVASIAPTVDPRHTRMQLVTVVDRLELLSVEGVSVVPSARIELTAKLLYIQRQDSSK